MWGRRGSSLGPRFHLELLQLDQSAHLVDHLGLEAVVNLSFFQLFSSDLVLGPDFLLFPYNKRLVSEKLCQAASL